MKPRTISNERYNKEWASEENRKILNKACFKYRGIIPDDDIQSCQMVALWRALESFDSLAGKKFTTYLYDGVVQCCRSWLEEYNRNKRIPIESNFISIIPEDDTPDIDEWLECLEESDKTLLKQRFIMKMTLKEIAQLNTCTPEAIRKRIKKAIRLVKENFSEEVKILW